MSKRVNWEVADEAMRIRDAAEEGTIEPTEAIKLLAELIVDLTRINAQQDGMIYAP